TTRAAVPGLGCKWPMMPGIKVVRLDPVSMSRRIGIGTGTDCPKDCSSRARPWVMRTRAGRIRRSSTDTVYFPMILHGCPTGVNQLAARRDDEAKEVAEGVL